MGAPRPQHRDRAASDSYRAADIVLTAAPRRVPARLPPAETGPGGRRRPGRYLCEIYSYLQQNFPCFRNAPDHRWKNSVRHNLSIHSEFKRVAPKEGQRRRQMADSQSKGAAGFWTVVEVPAEEADRSVCGDGGRSTSTAAARSRSPIGVATTTKARKTARRKSRTGVQKAAAAATNGGSTKAKPKAKSSSASSSGRAPATRSPSGQQHQPRRRGRSKPSPQTRPESTPNGQCGQEENLTQIAAALLLQLSTRKL